jgi:hypothetical protein
VTLLGQRFKVGLEMGVEVMMGDFIKEKEVEKWMR